MFEDWTDDEIWQSGFNAAMLNEECLAPGSMTDLQKRIWEDGWEDGWAEAISFGAVDA